MDEFMTDNVDMSDVGFEDVSTGHGERLGQQHNCQFVGEKYGDKFGRWVIISTRTIMLSYVEILVQLS
jgi:hypothetical protein